MLYPTQNVNWEDVKKKAVFTPNLPELDDNIDAGTEFRFNTDQKTRSCKPGRSFKVGISNLPDCSLAYVVPKNRFHFWCFYSLYSRYCKLQVYYLEGVTVIKTAVLRDKKTLAHLLCPGDKAST
jgi:hypothetical protein